MMNTVMIRDNACYAIYIYNSKFSETVIERINGFES